jgi:hypothetical protein
MIATSATSENWEKKTLSCLWLNKVHFILFLALEKCYFARNRDTVVVGRRKEGRRSGGFGLGTLPCPATPFPSRTCASLLSLRVVAAESSVPFLFPSSYRPFSDCDEHERGIRYCFPPLLQFSLLFCFFFTTFLVKQAFVLGVHPLLGPSSVSGAQNTRTQSKQKQMTERHIDT